MTSLWPEILVQWSCNLLRWRRLQEELIGCSTKYSVLDMLSSRCLLDIQVETSSR